MTIDDYNTALAEVVIEVVSWRSTQPPGSFSSVRAAIDNLRDIKSQLSPEDLATIEG